jgi:hypothetical protein
MSVSRTASATISELVDTKTPTNEIVIISVVLRILLLGLLALWILRRKCGVGEQDSGSEMATQSGRGATSGLIPPLFYTEHVTDPLMQEDLHEKV